MYPLVSSFIGKAIALHEFTQAQRLKEMYHGRKCYFVLMKLGNSSWCFYKCKVTIIFHSSLFTSNQFNFYSMSALLVKRSVYLKLFLTLLNNSGKYLWIQFVRLIVCQPFCPCSNRLKYNRIVVIFCWYACLFSKVSSKTKILAKCLRFPKDVSFYLKHWVFIITLYFK